MNRTHPLEDRLNRFTARWRRLLWVRGLAASAGWCVALLTAAAVCDYLWRSDDSTVRMMLAAVAAVGTSGAVYRFLYLPLRGNWSPSEAAAVIEQRVPALRNRLRTAVEFLTTRENEPHAGSAALRRAAVEDAAAAAARFEWDDLLDRRPVIRAVGLFAAAAAAVLVLAVLWPRTTAVAALRLLQPWSGPAWPRQTELRFGAVPSRVARGETFEVEITAASGTRLPRSLRVWTRESDGRTAGAEYDEMLSVAGSTAVWRRPNVQSSFAFRIEGGDDRSMPWHEVAVVPPVQITSLSIRLDPPEYSKLPTSEATAMVRALFGTSVTVSASVDRPVSSATLVWPGVGPIAAAIDTSGRQLAFPARGLVLRVQESGPYWFDLIDSDGVECRRQQRGEVIVVRDEPPQVRIEQPQMPAAVVAGAVLPVRIAAQDDLGLRRIGLHAERSAGSGGTTANTVAREPGDSLPADGAAASSNGTKPQSATSPPARAIEPRWIWHADGDTAIDGAVRSRSERISQGDAAGQDRRRTVEVRLPTADFQLAPGDELLLAASAEDWLGQRQTGETVRVAVISEEQWAQRIGIRLAALAGELQRALRMQQACRSEVLALQRRLAADAVSTETIERLEAAEAAQRQVRRALVEENDSAAAIVRALRDDVGSLERNRPPLADQLRGVGEAIDRIDRLIGGQITPSLIGAAKSLDSGGTGGADVPSAVGLLSRAADAQAEVVALLQSEIERLARNEQTRRAQAELSDLSDRQRRLWERTRKLGADTVGRSTAELPPSRRRQLAELSEEQQELARRFEQLIETLDRSGDVGDAARRAKETVRESQTLGTADHLRHAATAISENRLGQAAERQEKAAADLAHLAALLADRPLARPDANAVGRGAEQAAALKQWLVRLRERQRQCTEAAESLFGLGKGDGSATTAQRRAALAAEQQQLADELRRADGPERLSPAARAIAAMLADRMTAIAEAIKGDRPGVWIVARQREVLELMSQLIDVAEQAAAGGAFSIDAAEGGAVETGGQPRRTSALSSADVLMIVHWQRDLAARTSRLDQAIAGGTPTAEQKAEMTALAAEQSRLNAAVAEMLRQAAATSAANE